MRVFVAAAAAVLFASGCAEMGTWNHRAKTGRDMQADRAECAALAGQANRCLLWDDVFNDCMCGRGYVRDGVSCEK